MPNKPKQLAIGESGFEVEWCSEIAIDEYGDRDLDRDTYNFRDFRTKAAAMKFAKQIFPTDQNGAVRITPFTIEQLSDEWPYGRSKEYAGDSEFYEGE